MPLHPASLHWVPPGGEGSSKQAGKGTWRRDGTENEVITRWWPRLTWGALLMLLAAGVIWTSEQHLSFTLVPAWGYEHGAGSGSLYGPGGGRYDVKYRRVGPVMVFQKIGRDE